MARRDAVEYAMPYFRELVEDALARQRIAATEHAAYYIVRLLASFVQPGFRDDEAPLVVRLAKAMDTDLGSQRAGLKALADEALFVSGFFAESLDRRLVDVDYYVAIGGAAYHALGRMETDQLSAVFAELGRKFVAFVDVLTDVSERTSCSSNADVVRIYEKWLKTGSRRSVQRLIEKGLIPTRPGGSSPIQ